MAGKKQFTVAQAGEQVTDTTTTETPMTTTETEIEDESSELESEEHTDENTAAENQHSREISPIPTECPECESEDFSKSEKHGEITCNDCGEIVETIEFPEVVGWKRHAVASNETTTTVTGNNDAGINMNALGGTIDWKDMDGYGNSLSSKKRSQMHRLRDLDRRSDTSSPAESNYKYALGEINRISADIEVPRHVRDAASEYYEQALDADVIRGRSIEAVATAVLYTACEQKGFSRSMSEITAVSRAEHSGVVDTYEALTRELGIGDHGSDLRKYVFPLASSLDIDDDIAAFAGDLLEGTLTDELLEQGSLKEHTAAAMYIAAVRSGEVISQRKIADAIDVNHGAVRDCYRVHIEAVSSSAVA